jgi:hypothetical protein
VKLRLLLTSALFLFAQTPMMQAQETLDVAKITCKQILKEELASPTHEVRELLRPPGLLAVVHSTSCSVG